MDIIYYAKSKLPDGNQPTVQEHIEKVAEYAEKYGDAMGIKESARLAALLHDFGKYSDNFQKVLRDENQYCDHAMCGAAWLYYRLKDTDYKKWASVFEASIGHHDGLQSLDNIKSSLESNVSGDKYIPINNGKSPALFGKKEYKTAWKEFKKYFPRLGLAQVKEFKPSTEGLAEKQFEEMLYTRMIYSCLVDADYSVSASDKNKNYMTESEYTQFDVEYLISTLNNYMERLREKSDPNSELNKMRNMVFERCGEMGKSEEGLFTLTAPTGLGKTLAMLNFALRHCKANNKNRIIVVLPFLTLAEQNTKIYSDIVGKILIDHSQSNLTDKEKEFSERWSFPFIVTTTVKFFESLFSDKPTDCRKLHNIANSVVLFDEVQSLPAELTQSTLHAVKELCERYHTTMVFSSATQPEFGILPEMKKLGWNPKEILPEYKELYVALRRTEVDWQIEKKTKLTDIASEMTRLDSVCAIVNLRSHARILFDELEKHCNEDEIYFITTDICPEHRTKIINTIHDRLKNKQPCRVVATQCIEAGVDLDFNVLYRALAPLDSIIQAAGRCNRNGKMSERGKVTVFIPDETGNLYPGIWYENAAMSVKELYSRHNIDIHNPEHIREYYQLIFENTSDKKTLINAIKNRGYADVAEEYKLIEDYGYHIIVPYGDKYTEIRDKIRRDGITPKLIHDTASITVTAFVNKGQNIKKFAEQLMIVKKRGEKSRSNYYLMQEQHKDLYTSKMGLQFPKEVIFDALW